MVHQRPPSQQASEPPALSHTFPLCLPASLSCCIVLLQVYVRHHRALTPPPLTSGGPRSSASACWSSSSWLSQQQAVLGRGYSRRAGVTAWLLPVSYPGQTVHSLPPR